MKKKTMSPEMRKLYETDPAEFFRRVGAQGGAKRNKLYTKKDMSRWGAQGAQVAKKTHWSKRKKAARKRRR